jgi:hypothetical protein
MKSIFEFRDSRWKGKWIWNVTAVSMHQYFTCSLLQNTILYTHYQRDQINGSRHGSCSMHWGGGNAYEVLVRKPEDTGMYGLDSVKVNLTETWCALD